MPLVIVLVGALLQLASSMVGRVLLALGLSYITYSGFDLAVGWLLDQIKTSVGGMPSEVINFLGFIWVDKAIGMMFSAYAAALAIKAAGGSTITKMVRK